MARQRPVLERRPERRLRVVVTAGPTREHLDDVRFLSNGSTGRMGIELARQAAGRGAHVVLVLGPTLLEPPAGVEVVHVVSAQEMLDATKRASAGADLVLFAAAPADWRPAKRRPGKPPKSKGPTRLALVPTVDGAATLGRRKGSRVHVGFALEVSEGGTKARAKLRTKRFDAIVLNSPDNLGSGGGDARWIVPGAEAVPLPTTSKDRLARAILDRSWPLALGRAPDLG